MSPEPVIPDHEVLRKIGGGSYGEVWLARGVTGAMRAVKVVRREDFEDERGFEREFEGILKYEPMSRDHAGLVNILHVGRSNQEGGFYYYVMELGDDIRTGSDINAVEYSPRNLRTDMKKADGKPLDPDFVIEVGLSLAEALQHLHEKGLAHRDIKPSNIIFVDGKAKLADIGLVAARGQRTFVGTEGFVPPEGPGSAQADVYGLGKVMYEMATGKDRLQFPELPDELPESANRKRWLTLNQIICDICEPRVSKRTIKTAAALALSLRRLQRGKRVRRRRSGVMFTVIPALACLALLAWIFRAQLPWLNPVPDVVVEDPVEKKIEYGFVKVISDPEGAEVYDSEGNFLDITPLKNIRMVAGQRYEFEFRLEGYRTERKEGTVEAGETKIVEHVMSIYSPPVEGQEWVDNMGIHYQPMDGYHISTGFVRAYQWRRFEQDTKKKYRSQTIEHSESGVKRRVVVVKPEAAEAYCRWQSEKASTEGYLNEVQYISPLVSKSFSSPAMTEKLKNEGLRPFQCLVKNIPFAHLEIHTEPEGAILQIDGEYRGITPRSRVRVKPGPLELNLSLEGYRRVTKKMNLKEGGNQKVVVNMQRNNSIVFGHEWTNSLGMKFVPVGEDLLVSIWETRIADYQIYLNETKAKRPPAAGFQQGPMHPVLQVSRDDAIAFCKWLTERERKEERISTGEEYRLLTDAEWSHLVGLEEKPDQLPAEREFRPERIFPWGTAWPPETADEKVGNLADKTAAQAANVSRDRTLLSYDDGFEKTSPVGSFPPNELGIYDLAGNAHEWVSDDYDGKGKYGVLRGGGWNSYKQKDLYVTQRNTVRPSKISNLYGFRVVIAKKVKLLTSSIDDEFLDPFELDEEEESSDPDE
ncbi:SUMF1/EgtB/PvdO family nonheme iron enzyme [Verrucomicrobiaceae bacterium 5K15]|uniref:SUMF1/EgtB/PvdO family nonheme iron enzyme n=1 Tax=Oceaniferula flava TaxID=2800421 RepID=A0AAE2SEE0_9BACT|nr:SUMF1/EgtB/PvdO family nonheme iron enzyme [Oceaniferula flavus]